MHKLAHILRLGLKELTSLRHDSVLLLFLFYAFTVAIYICLLYTSPSPRDGLLSRMPSSA